MANPFPRRVTEALEKLQPGGDRYFWNGNGKLTTRVGNWSRYLDAVFTIADIEGGRSHRFRDTFATALLQSGCPVEDVAALLGNSPKIVVKHDAPWIRERQVRLEERMKAAWAS